VRPSPTMTAVEKLVELELLRGAGHEPGRAGDHLRTGVDGQDVLDLTGEPGPRVCRDQDGHPGTDALDREVHRDGELRQVTMR
jgi:hypothetical protein